MIQLIIDIVFLGEIGDKPIDRSQRYGNVSIEYLVNPLTIIGVLVEL